MWHQDIFLQYPQAIYCFLLILPIIYGQWRLAQYRRIHLNNYADSHFLSQLLIPRSKIYTNTKMVGYVLIWILVGFALMAPFGNVRYPVTSTDNQSTWWQDAPQEIIVLVDTSASMRVVDASQGRSRLEEAKILVDELIGQLRGQLVSLYAFTSELTPIVPSTLDYLFARLTLTDLQIDQGDVGGTNFTIALQAIHQQIVSEKYFKHYIMILISDGGDVPFDEADQQAKAEIQQRIIEAVNFPSSVSFHLFSIGVGSKEAQLIPNVTLHDKAVYSKLEPFLLQKLTSQTNGVYYESHDWSSWDLAHDLMKHIENFPSQENKATAAEKPIDTIKKQPLVDLYYQIPLGLALLLYFLNFLLPDVQRL